MRTYEKVFVGTQSSPLWTQESATYICRPPMLMPSLVRERSGIRILAVSTVSQKEVTIQNEYTFYLLFSSHLCSVQNRTQRKPQCSPRCERGSR